MTRRVLLLAPLAACLRADSEKEVEELIASAASALSAGKPELFLDAFDPAMPEFAKLRYSVIGLTSQADLSCSIEILSNEGDDGVRKLTLDWILRIDHKDDNPGSGRTARSGGSFPSIRWTCLRRPRRNQAPARVSYRCSSVANNNPEKY